MHIYIYIYIYIYICVWEREREIKQDLGRGVNENQGKEGMLSRVIK